MMATVLVAVAVAIAVGVGIGWLLTRRAPVAPLMPDPVILAQYADKRAHLVTKRNTIEADVHALSKADLAAALRSAAR